MLFDPGTISSECWSELVGCGPNSVDPRLNVVDVGRLRSKMVEVAQHLVDSGPKRPMLVERASILGTVANSAAFERCRSKFGHTGRGVRRIWATSTGSGPTWAKSAWIPRICTALVPKRWPSNIALAFAHSPQRPPPGECAGSPEVMDSQCAGLGLPATCLGLLEHIMG